MSCVEVWFIVLSRVWYDDTLGRLGGVHILACVLSSLGTFHLWYSASFSKMTSVDYLKTFCWYSREVDVGYVRTVLSMDSHSDEGNCYA